MVGCSNLANATSFLRLSTPLPLKTENPKPVACEVDPKTFKEEVVGSDPSGCLRSSDHLGLGRNGSQLKIIKKMNQFFKAIFKKWRL